MSGLAEIGTRRFVEVKMRFGYRIVAPDHQRPWVDEKETGRVGVTGD